MKPDYEAERSKAKRAANLIEFAEAVLVTLLATDKGCAIVADGASDMARSQRMDIVQAQGLRSIEALARKYGL